VGGVRQRQWARGGWRRVKGLEFARSSLQRGVGGVFGEPSVQDRWTTTTGGVVGLGPSTAQSN
jgi:hypothetical protein